MGARAPRVLVALPPSTGGWECHHCTEGFRTRWEACWTGTSLQEICPNNSNTNPHTYTPRDLIPLCPGRANTDWLWMSDFLPRKQAEINGIPGKEATLSGFPKQPRGGGRAEPRAAPRQAVALPHSASMHTIKSYLISHSALHTKNFFGHL